MEKYYEEKEAIEKASGGKMTFGEPLNNENNWTNDGKSVFDMVATLAFPIAAIIITMIVVGGCLMILNLGV